MAAHIPDKNIPKSIGKLFKIFSLETKILNLLYGHPSKEVSSLYLYDKLHDSYSHYSIYRSINYLIHKGILVKKLKTLTVSSPDYKYQHGGLRAYYVLTYLPKKYLYLLLLYYYKRKINDKITKDD
ncbi:hypothetical protein ES705_49673 [subsurface metagenome]